MPLPDAYVAGRTGPLTLRSSTGAAPEYATGSSNTTAMSTLLPMPYAPSAEAGATDATDGALASTAMSLRPPSEFAVPGGGRTRLARRPVAACVIVAPAERALAPA